jgi:ABC-2 type transport system ATP-binding protein
MSTHTLHIAEDLCHRIGVIHRGKLLALGTVAQLKKMARADHADLEELFMILTDSKAKGDPPL